MKQELAAIHRELTTGRLTPAQAETRIEALKQAAGAPALATWLAAPVWVDAAQAEPVDAAYLQHRILLADLPPAALADLQARVPGSRCVSMPITASATPGEVYAKVALKYFETVRGLLLDKPQGPCLVQLVTSLGDEAQLLAGLSGLIDTAALENPLVVGQVVAVDASLSSAELARCLLAERGAAQDRVLRHTGGRRQVRRWRWVDESAAAEPATSSAASTSARSLFKEHGCYLVTGGLGGLGALVAREILAQAAGARVVLAGRGAATGAKLNLLKSLQALGRVDYRQADVGDAEQVQVLVGSIEREHGPLNGVLHSAGVLRDDFIVKKGSAQFLEVLQPKVAGTEHLDAATRHMALDFFVLFSSIASWAGNLGQADYAAANGFMEEFAAYRNRLVAAGERAGRSLAIGWPHWVDGGMNIDATSLSHLEKRTGLRSMDTAAGMAALQRSLALPQAHVMVMHGDAAEMLRTLEAPRVLPAALTASAPVAVSVDGSLAKPAAVSTSKAAPAAGAAARVSTNTPTAPVADLPSRTREFLRQEFAAVLKIPANRIEPKAALENYGIDSILAMNLTSQLEASFGALPKTLFFEYQTLDELAGYFSTSHAAKLNALLAPAASMAVAAAPTLVSVSVPVAAAAALSATSATQPGAVNLSSRIASRRGGRSRFLPASDAAQASSQPAASAPSTAYAHEPIAIVGLSGRYPESRDLEAFWRNLRDGRDCIVEVPASRWDWKTHYSEDRTQEGAHFSKWGGFIEGVDEFDPRFFNIAPREARTIDPQERLFLQHAWMAVEDAGYTRASLQMPSGAAQMIGQVAGQMASQPGQVGVYAGVMYGEYNLSGSLASIANRVSYFLNLHGPSLTLDTMCSSSLTALHLACQDLRTGRTNLALAGGVNVSVHPNKYTMLSGGQFISGDGHCQSFGEGGDGYIPGEGVGVAVLKRLSDAERDGNTIYGVIRGSALNHGGKTNGYTVPNPQAQAEVIRRALTEAGIEPRHVSYIEAHGTGTKLGDPIEIAALTRAFRESVSDGTQDTGYCLIGSAKSNIGHCESAAGIAGVSKVLLQMKHGAIVPSLHSRKLNPHIDFGSTPFTVVQQLQPWSRPVVDGLERPRIAGISSFGAGGSNAHVIIEEYRAPAVAAAADRAVIVPLSARTAEQLQQRVRELLAHLEGQASTPHLLDVAWTLQAGREAMEERVAFVVESMAELLSALRRHLAGEASSKAWRDAVKPHKEAIAQLVESSDFDTRLTQWIAARELAALAPLWVRGLEIDWRGLGDGAAARFISLPAYPFARERHWQAPAAVVGSAKAVAAVTPRLHPLVHANTSNLLQPGYRSVFRADDALLIDAAQPGWKMLPALRMLDAMQAAAELAWPREAAGDLAGHWELRQLAWGEPFQVAVGGEGVLQISLFPRGEDQVDVELHSGSGEAEQVHAQGQAVFSRQPALPPLDLIAIRSGLQAQGDAFAATGRLLAPLPLSEAEGGVLPAALLQGVDALLSRLLGASVEPVSLQQARLCFTPTPAAWAWLRLQPNGSVDIDLCDAQGRVGVQLVGWVGEGAGSGVAASGPVVTSLATVVAGAAPAVASRSAAEVAPAASAASPSVVAKALASVPVSPAAAKAGPAPVPSAASIAQAPVWPREIAWAVTAASSGAIASSVAASIGAAAPDFGPVPAKPTQVRLPLGTHAAAVPTTPVEAKGQVRLAVLGAAAAASAGLASATGITAPIRIAELDAGFYTFEWSGALAECLSAIPSALQRLRDEPGLKLLSLRGLQSQHTQAWQGGRDVVNAAIDAGVFRVLAGFPCPVIGVVSGPATGAGLLLAAACDFLVLDAEATHGYTDASAGLWPTEAEDRLFRARLGDALADDLLYRNLKNTGSAWQAKGWACRVAAPADLATEARRLAELLRSKSRLALELLKTHLGRHIAPALQALAPVDVAPAAGERGAGASSADRVLTVKLAAKRKGADLQALAQLLKAGIERAAKSPEIHAVVLTGGADEFLPKTNDAAAVKALLALVRSSPVPVIAALESDASAAGWLLALACDGTVYRQDARYAAGPLWAAPALAREAAVLAAQALGRGFGAEVAMGEAELSGAALQARVPTLAAVEKNAVLAEAQRLATAWAAWPREALEAWKKAQAARLQAGVEALPELAAEAKPVAASKPLNKDKVKSQDQPAQAAVAASADAAELTPVPLSSRVVSLATRADGVVLVTMHDRDAKNMFSAALVEGLREAFDHIDASSEHKAVVLTGYDNYFATGGTRETLLAIQDGQAQFTDEKIFQRPMDCKLPVIAAIQGHGIGGGWSFGMFADLVLLSEESRYLSPYMGYGFTPGAGSTLMFPARIGLDLARETLMGAQEVSGSELKARGLVLPVLPRREVLPQALALAGRLARQPRERLQALKALWSQPLRAARDDTYARELAMHERTFVRNEQTLQTIQAKFAGDGASSSTAGASASSASPSALSSEPQATPRSAALPASAVTTAVASVAVPAVAAPASAPAVVTAAAAPITAAALIGPLRTMLAQELFLQPDEIDEDTQFIELGLDSITGVTWIRKINAQYGTEIEATKVYSRPTLRQLAALVAAERAAMAAPVAATPVSVAAAPVAIAAAVASPVVAPAPMAPQTLTAVTAPAMAQPAAVASAPVGVSLDQVIATIRVLLAKELLLSPDEIEDRTPFIEMGLDSITGVTWVRKINETYGTEIEATKVYSHPTLLEIGRLVKDEADQAAAPLAGPAAAVVAVAAAPSAVGPAMPRAASPAFAAADATPERHVFAPVQASPAATSAGAPAPLSSAATAGIAAAPRRKLISWRRAGAPLRLTTALVDAQAASAQPAARSTPNTAPIAVIGMAGQFPKARNIDEFWANLAAGRNCIDEVPATRWSVADYFQPGAPTPGKTSSKWLGALDDFDAFDPLFFSISPTEAECMEPQQRLFLQAAWHAIEHAGYSPASLSGSACGVFVGCGPSDYHQASPEHQLSAQGFTGAASSILAARISYFLNLQGPCLAIETACSSSLVAMASACDSLNNGHSDVALAGGVYVMAGPAMHIMTSQAGMLSADGRCFSFDQRANGFVPGEAVGVVMLKRLADAERDHDRILGLIEGWGVNQDGKTNGITAPNEESQTRLIQNVYRRFGIDPAGIQLIEAHGTGTKLGDPIEVAGLKAAFKPFTQAIGTCALGSVKSNIGHCLTAAGSAGVIKLLLSIQHRALPPTIHYAQGNEHIRLDRSPFYVNDTLKPWTVPAGARRRAAVSSFGFSGTNAHLVIAEHLPAVDPQAEAVTPLTQDGRIVVPLSARTEPQLRELAQALLARLRGSDTIDFHALAYTLQQGRDAMGERLGFLAASNDELAKSLQTYLDSDAASAGAYQGQVKRHRDGIKLIAQDEEMKATIVGKWLTERKLAKLLDLWVKGLDLDWTQLWGAAKPVRAALPLYPFAKDRYHLTPTAPVGLTATRATAAQKAATPAAKLPARLPTKATTALATVPNVKAKPEPQAARHDTLSYLPDWVLQARPAAPTQAAAPRSVLVVHSGDTLGLAEAVAARCQAQGAARVVSVGMAAQTQQIASDAWTCGVADAAGWAQCLQGLDTVDALYFIAGQGAAGASAGIAAEHNELQLLRLVQALKQQGRIAGRVDTWLLTMDCQASGIAGASGEASLASVRHWGAGLAGLGYSLAQGQHQFRVRSLDLSAADLIGRSPAQLGTLTDAIAQEPASDRGEVFKLRGGERLRQTFLPLQWEAGALPAFRQGGVYLIVGGSGIVGRIISRQLLDKYRAQVVWIGRSAATSASVQQALAGFADAAERLHYLQADVTDEAALRAALAQLKQRLPRFDGAIFSGMVSAPELPIDQADEAQFRLSIGVKTLGCQAFHVALRDEPLDFMCFFSSGQAYAFSGAAKLPAYASGITAADGYVRSISADGAYPIGTINWGFWMAAVRERIQKIDGISTKSIDALEDLEGFACFERFVAELQQGRVRQVLCMRASREVQALMNCSPRERVALVGSVQANPPVLSEATIAIAHERIAELTAAQARSGLNEWFARLLFCQLDHLVESAGVRLPLSIGELRSRCGVVPKYAPWFQQSLEMLAEEGLIGLKGDTVRDWPLTDRTSTWVEWRAQREVYLRDPDRKALATLIDECLEKLPDILQGRLLATDVLFPHSSMEKVGALYKNNSTADTFNATVAATVQSYVQQRLAQDPAAKLRILEVGAGTGGTSAIVFKTLQPHKAAIAEYCYTDLSKAFFFHAEKHYLPDNPYIVCQRLNIEEPIDGQGIESGSYDLVISTNALHATKDIRNTLRNAKAALRKDGFIIVSEMSDASLSTHLTFGLLDGWWLFEDAELRIPGCPGLYPETWQRVLEEEGFNAVELPGSAARPLGNQVMVGRSNGRVRRVTPKDEPAAEAMAEREGFEPAAIPLAAAAPAARRAPARRAAKPAVDLATRVRRGLLDSLSATLKMPADQIDPDIAFSDYGIDSILGVNFIDRLNERFGLGLNTAIIFEFSSIERLSRHIVETYADLLKAADEASPEEGDDEVTAAQAPAAPRRAVAHAVQPVKKASKEASKKTSAKAWAAPVDVATEVRRGLLDSLSATLKMPADQIDADIAFSDYGIDSILGVNFIDRLNERFGLGLNTAIIFEFSSIDRLSRHLVETYAAQLQVSGSAADDEGADDELGGDELEGDELVEGEAWEENGDLGADAFEAAEEPAQAAASQAHHALAEIAIIGLSGQFPKADNVEQFWRNLVDGVDGVEEVPAHYLDQASHYTTVKQKGKTRCKWAGILADRDCFDPLFFSISPKEAESMNPHQRLVMQESWNALEDAGYNAKALSGSQTAIFIGAEPAGYVGDSFTGLSDAIIASRLSYVMNFQGPAFVVNTGCSSSAVAIHLACESLRNGESELVLAGGVNACLHQDILIRLDQIEMLSPSGRCFTFDKAGDGTIISEGVGMVVLKRLDDAIADGDAIYATICGSGMNQDGASNGITAPNGAAQEQLILSVYERFGIHPEQISYVEAHGTGTKLGDPVETNALVRAFRKHSSRQGWCAVGSAKSHIGHAAAAAGVIGIIKVLMSMKHRLLPKLLNFKDLNPLIQFDGSPFYVNAQTSPWQVPGGGPRMAAINSFGHSGTNVHLVVKEHAQAVAPRRVAAPAGGFALPLSAKTSEQLRQRAQALLRFLQGEGAVADLASLAYTLQLGRESMDERLGLVADSVPALAGLLTAYLDGDAQPGRLFRGQARRHGETEVPRRGEAAASVLERWTAGRKLDWQALWAGAAVPGRLHLPAYPFAKERYWMSSALGREGAAPAVAAPVATGSAPKAELPLPDQKLEDILSRIADDSLGADEGVQLLKMIV